MPMCPVCSYARVPFFSVQVYSSAKVAPALFDGRISQTLEGIKSKCAHVDEFLNRIKELKNACHGGMSVRTTSRHFSVPVGHMCFSICVRVPMPV